MYTRYVVKILHMYKGSRIATNLYYLEIEAWLSRMESWQERLRPVGATQDILEQQSREVKVMKNVNWLFLNIRFLFFPLLKSACFLNGEWFHQKYFIRSKDWPAKKVTIYFPIFYLVKSSENTLFFYLHFT